MQALQAPDSSYPLPSEQPEGPERGQARIRHRGEIKTEREKDEVEERSNVARGCVQVNKNRERGINKSKS